MTSQLIINNQKDFYSGLLEKYDIHSQSAVAWFDGGQEARFRELVRIIPDRTVSCSLLDVGCGMGDMRDYLIKNGYPCVDYTGIDALGEMVESGKRKYPGIRLTEMEFMADSYKRGFDILVSSGAMNLRMFRTEKKQEKYVTDFIGKLYGLSGTGCAFNLLSTGESRHFSNDRNIFYADRIRTYALCKEICGDVELVFKSEIFGFTVYMRKDSAGGVP
jgi:SAM-dependent methyltransferase